jgi:hypothetical protein
VLPHLGHVIVRILLKFVSPLANSEKKRVEWHKRELLTAFYFMGTPQPISEKGNYPLPRQIFVTIIQPSSFFAAILSLSEPLSNGTDTL